MQWWLKQETPASKRQRRRWVVHEGVHTAFVLELGGYLHMRFLLLKAADGFRQEIDGLSYHKTDGYAVPVFGAEVLPLFNGTLQIIPHIDQKTHKLLTGRRKGCPLSVSFKNFKFQF